MNAQAERLSIDQWMVGWNPSGDCRFARPCETPGAVEVGPWPDSTGWSQDMKREAMAQKTEGEAA